MQVAPGATFTAIAEGFDTGLVGTIGVRIENPDGSNHTPRTTVGIVELEPGFGVYAKDDLVAPDARATYALLWDDPGSGQEASEELVVTSNLPPSGFYCSAEDVRKALAPEGAEDQSTAAEMSDDAIYREVTNAQQEIDARLRDRYMVPFADGEVPGLVSTITADIAAYLSTLTQRRAGEVVEDDTVRLRYARAKELLEKLGDGTLDLDVPPAEVQAGAGEPSLYNQYDGDLFDEEQLGVRPRVS